LVIQQPVGEFLFEAFEVGLAGDALPGDLGDEILDLRLANLAALIVGLARLVGGPGALLLALSDDAGDQIAQFLVGRRLLRQGETDRPREAGEGLGRIAPAAPRLVGGGRDVGRLALGRRRRRLQRPGQLHADLGQLGEQAQPALGPQHGGIGRAIGVSGGCGREGEE